MIIVIVIRMYSRIKPGALALINALIINVTVK